jgi:hypothetical protein
VGNAAAVEVGVVATVGECKAPMQRKIGALIVADCDVAVYITVDDWISVLRLRWARAADLSADRPPSGAVADV